MCEIILDVIALMYIVGGSCLGILAVRGYRKYLKNKVNANDKPNAATDQPESPKDFTTD